MNRFFNYFFIICIMNLLFECTLNRVLDIFNISCKKEMFCIKKNNQYSNFKLIEVVFHSSWKSFHEPFFLKLLLHHLYYYLLFQCTLNRVLDIFLTYSVRKKCFVLKKQFIPSKLEFFRRGKNRNV
jgi:hypothetical protein